MTNPNPHVSPAPSHIRQEVVALLKLGLPVIGAQLAVISMNFVDTVMAGRLSPRALAAVAVAGSVWMMVAIFVAGFLLAVTASVAHLFGAGERANVGRVVRQSLWLSQGLALVCFLIVRNAVGPIVRAMEIDPEIIPITLGYIDAITFSLPAVCAYTVLRYFSEGVSMTRPVMFVSLIATVANIGANYVFMHGKLGFPAMGAVGCGWASALVMWLMFSCMLTFILIHRHYRQFCLFAAFDWPDRSEIARIVKLGLPIGVSVFMEASLFATVALLMGSLGTSVVAGHQIAINVASITFMIPLGLSMAITVRVGQAMGRGSPSDARRAGFVGVGLALAIMVVTATLILLFPAAIVSIYTDDVEVTAIAIELLFFAAVFQLSDGAQVAGAGALRGLKDTAIPMVMTFVAYWGIGVPLGYTLGISWAMGPQTIWFGLIAGLTVAAVCLNGRFWWVTRARLADQLAVSEASALHPE